VSTIVPVPLRDPAAVTLTGLRVAHYTDLPPLSPTAETAEAVASAVAALARAGCVTRPLGPLPDSGLVYEKYMALLYGDGGAAVARTLDRWGSAESPLRERLARMTALASAEMTALYEWLDRWRSRMLALLAEHDAIVGPVNAAPAPLHGAFERPTAAFTQVYNLTGWPSTAVRAGTSNDGLPIGVQVVAHPWREDVSLALAAQIETALGPFPGPAL
jgi:amidase